MLNFTFHNPVKMVFGIGTIAQVAELTPAKGRILMTYGGGSIKRNGVYEQVKLALKGRDVLEFGGIEPNPLYETCMKAVELCRNEKVDFILAVGGGSVIDGSKFIAAAVPYQGTDPWDILCASVGVQGAEVKSAIPLGDVLTLPATGTEMNPTAVVSRKSTQQKRYFASPHISPRFSILDPETTFTLPEKQTANGIVDAFIHVVEQYLTSDVNSPLQDRQAEAVLLTLIEEAPKVLANPRDYDARANIMWSATCALNGLLGCGVKQDWATHMIGHELTAVYGLDHAQTLAVVLPPLLRRQKKSKLDKLVKMGERVFGIRAANQADKDAAAEKTIVAIEAFFHSVGVPTKLAAYKINAADAAAAVYKQIKPLNSVFGENADITPEVSREIVAAAG
jgi:NADP-dependent alcohol dehydrogenase